AVVASVTDRCARAMDIAAARLAPDAPRRFVVAGGVAANQRLRDSLRGLAETKGYSFHVPPPQSCSDNAAIIASAVAERLALGLIGPLGAPVRPRWPLDLDAQPAIGAGVKA